MTHGLGKYDKGEVYALSSLGGEIFYIGSTVKSLKDRLSLHLCAYRSYLNGMNASDNLKTKRIIELKGCIKIVSIKSINFLHNGSEIDMEFLRSFEKMVIRTMTNKGFKLTNITDNKPCAHTDYSLTCYEGWGYVDTSFFIPI